MVVVRMVLGVDEEGDDHDQEANITRLIGGTLWVVRRAIVEAWTVLLGLWFSSVGKVWSAEGREMMRLTRMAMSMS